jgi:hypothetical protein
MSEGLMEEEDNEMNEVLEPVNEEINEQWEEGHEK